MNGTNMVMFSLEVIQWQPGIAGTTGEGGVVFVAKKYSVYNLKQGGGYWHEEISVYNTMLEGEETIIGVVYGCKETIRIV